MEKKTAFACTFLAAMGATIYVGCKWKACVAKAMANDEVIVDDIPPNDEPEPAPTHVSDKGVQTDTPTSVDAGVQISPSHSDAVSQTDVVQPEFEDLTAEEIPEITTVPPNGWLERIWG